MNDNCLIATENTEDTEKNKVLLLFSVSSVSSVAKCSCCCCRADAPLKERFPSFSLPQPRLRPEQRRAAAERVGPDGIDLELEGVARHALRWRGHRLLHL